MVLQFLSKLQKKDLKATANQTFEAELNDFRTDEEKKNFFLKHVPLSLPEIELLSKVIKSSTKLENLSLIGCNLDHLDVLQPVLKAIKRSKTIKSLNLSHNSLNTDCIRLICEVIQLKTSIQELDLSNCDLKSEDSKFLKTMLEYNKSLKSLGLNNNSKLKDNGLKSIVTGLLASPLSEDTALEEVDLSECSLTDSSMKELSTLLINSKLKKLSVADNFISKVGSKTLATGLKSSRTLEYFDISGNAITDDGLRSILALFSANSQLKQFSVNSCGLTYGGLKKLFETVIKYDNLIGLSFNNNHDSEAKETLSSLIINLISFTTRLEHIDCSNIDFTEDDFKNLGHFLGMTLKCTIKSLNLSNTNLTDQGVVELADGLYLNRELADLDITKNPFSIKGVRALAKTLKRNKSMKVLRISGQTRIKAEGENHLAEILKYNKTLKIKGTSTELDYLNSFAHEGGAFVWNSDKTKILSWSEDSWQVVKRGTGQIIGVAIENLSKAVFKQFIADEVIFKSRNIVSQDMFEYVIRHADKPCLEVVSVFVNKCGIPLDTMCESKTSKNSSSEYRKSDDVTYRDIAKEHAKDEIVKELAKNNKLFLSRYLTKNGPAIHETNEVLRVEAVDTQKGRDKEKVFIEIYENERDFEREVLARDAMKEKLRGGGPFAIYDTIIKEIEVHKENNCISFLLPNGGSMSGNLTDLRHCINNIGITAGYDIQETIFLLKRAAQCLGTVNNLGRVHGDFRPRNFIKVASKRLGKDPLGKTSKQVILPDKWVLMDFSKSLEHGAVYTSRLRDEKSSFGFDGSCGSGYLAPEVARIIFHKNSNNKVLPKVNEKQDVWSFGVVLYQLLTGVHLFNLEQNTDKLYKKQDKLELMNWINLDEARKNLILHRASESLFLNETTFKRIKEAAIDLCLWCLQGNPFNRPNFNEILSHPLFYYKTTVNYNNLDLLLGWYDKIGSSKQYSKALNGRPHYHVLNSSLSFDILQNLEYYLKKKGSCSVTSDLDDYKLDIQKRKERVQKARTIIILLQKGIFRRRDIIISLLWAKESKEFHNFVLMDLSQTKLKFGTSNGDLVSTVQPEVTEDMLKVSWDDISVKTLKLKKLYPISEKVNLSEIKDDEKLKFQKYLDNILENDIKKQRSKVIPYRTNKFQIEAMIDEILKRSKLVSDTKLLEEEKREEKEEAEAEQKEEKQVEGTKLKVVVMFKEEEDRIKENVEKLTAKILRRNKEKAEIDLISSSNKLLSLPYITLLSGTSKGNKNLRQLQIKEDTKVIVLLMVSKGFYNEFNKDIVLLEQAKGNISMIPISYNCYDLSSGEGKEEVLNLGIENETITNRLLENKSYIPLPIAEEDKDGLDLKYETKAAMDFIKQETEKVSGIMKLNEEKDENDVYTRYTRTNFFETVY